MRQEWKAEEDRRRRREEAARSARAERERAASFSEEAAARQAAAALHVDMNASGRQIRRETPFPLSTSNTHELHQGSPEEQETRLLPVVWGKCWLLTEK